MVCYIDKAGHRPVLLRPGFQSKKRLFAVLFSLVGPMAVDILPEKTTMTSHHYTGALLAKVVSAVLEQQLNVRITRRTLLLHGNATPPHTTKQGPQLSVWKASS